MSHTTGTNRLLSLEQVRHLIPYSASQIYRLEKDNDFPHRVSIGPNRVAWIKDEIDRWLEQRVAERDSKLARRSTPATKIHNTEQMPSVKDSEAASEPSELADHRCDHG
jgi:prophage regulatory protein